MARPTAAAYHSYVVETTAAVTTAVVVVHKVCMYALFVDG